MFDAYATMLGLTPEEVIRRKTAEAGLKPAQPPPLPPEEAEGVLRKAANAGLGALHYIGGTLDKTFGGRAIRAGIGMAQGMPGKGSELLSMIPFSDAAGLTDERNRVSGEDILKNAGVLQGDGQKGTFELRDLAGPALEMALDPSMYLSLGTSRALTEAGKAAAKAGTLPAKASERISQGLAGLANVGLPFTEGAAVGTGQTAAKVASWLEGKADKLAYGRVGRAMSEMFDGTVKGMKGAEAQKNIRGVQPMVRAGEKEVLDRHLEFGKMLEQHGLLDAGSELRQVMEGTYNGPVRPELQAVADRAKLSLEAMRDEARALGLHRPELDDRYIPYAPRFGTPPKGETPGFVRGRRSDLQTSTPSAQPREELLMDLPGGTNGRNGVNDLLKDQQLRQLIAQNTPGSQAMAEALVRQKYYGMTPAQEAQLAAWKAMPPAGNLKAQRGAYQEYKRLLEIEEKAKRAPGYVAGFDPRIAEQQHNYFDNHFLTDFTQYGISHKRAVGNATAAHGMLADAALAPGAAVAGEVMPALEALKSVHLDGTVGGVMPGAQKLVDNLVASGKLPAGATVADLAGVNVPHNVVADALRATGMPVRPDEINPLLQAFDSITNMTKGMQTSPWPGFHARNLVTGLWQNVSLGAYDPTVVGGRLNPYAWIKPYRDAMAMRNNGVVEGAADIFKATHPGIDDAQATRLLHEGMFSTKARVGIDQTMAGEQIGRGYRGDPVTMALPGTGGERTVAEVLNPATHYRELAAEGASLKDMVNPFNQRGVGQNTMGLGGPAREETKNLLLKYGQEAGQLGDDLNRMSAFVALKKQGFSDAEAALRSKAAHYDYSKLAPFERDVMRRIIPFYNWTRQNVPYQLAELATNPGGATAKGLQLLDNMRAQAGYAPPGVTEGMAIPVGQNDKGRQTYLSHFGMPVEDAFSFLGTGGSPLTRTMEKTAGMLNPLLKGPLEVLADKQMYSGRSLDDLTDITGAPLIDQAIMNSPLSRVVTTSRQLSSDKTSPLRKAANLVGPFKFDDVDTAKQEDLAAREFIEGKLKHSPAVRNFETMYVKPEMVSMLSPEELQLYRLYRYLEQSRQKAAKAKKEATKP